MATIKNYREVSPVEVFFSLIGGRFKAAILWNLAQVESMRYNQISRLLPEHTPKMLTQQLRSMEADGFIKREIYPEVPPRVEYSLTDLGKSLYPIINDIHLWSIDYVNNIPEEIAPHTPKKRRFYK